MLASLVLVTVIGCLLALVTNMSAAIAFRLPWRGPIPLGGRRNELALLQAPKLTAPFLVLGFGALLAAYAILALAALTLGTLAGPVQGAIIVVAALWFTGILTSIVCASMVDPYQEELMPGDPDFDFAFALAQKSGLALKSLRVVSRPVDRNELAIQGIIALTLLERSDLTDAERQIILTQWVGALRFAKESIRSRLMRGGVILLVVIAAGLVAMDLELRGGAIPLIVLLPIHLGNIWSIKFGKQREAVESKKIDKFTLQAMGDYLLVQQAIAKDFLLTLKANKRESMSQRDEDMAVHDRLNLLREAAKELGINPATLQLP